MKLLLPFQKNTENKLIPASPSMVTLLLMISFATFNAVLFTPALPNIASYFSINDNVAQLTVTWFLVGYALGQLLYGPLANHFGRKNSLYTGIGIQIVSSFLCLLAGLLHNFTLLVFARFFVAIGSGVGLTIAFTIVNESFVIEEANQKIAYLILALAIMPGLSIALGGMLNHHFGWMSCFYAGIIYGLILFFLTTRLTETCSPAHPKTLNIRNLVRTYLKQLQNPAVLLGGLLMGGATCFNYVFTTLTPFIAINSLGMNSKEFGMASTLPTLGYVMGSIISARFAKKHTYKYGIQLGITIAGISVILMVLITWFIPKSPLLTLFFPMILICIGLPLIYSNASTFAMSHTSDKAHGSATMNFINLTFVMLSVLSLSLFSSTQHLLLSIFALIIAGMVIIYKFSRLKN